MTYGSSVWYTPKEVKKSNLTDKLAILQNQCLRMIAGAFKATPISVLEAETFIATIDIHLDQLQAKARYRLRDTGQSRFIARTCTSIANKLRGKAGRQRAQKPTTGVLKHEWARSMLADAPTTPFPNPPPPRSNVPPIYRDKLGAAKVSQRKHFQLVKVRQTDTWSNSWKTYQNDSA